MTRVPVRLTWTCGAAFAIALIFAGASQAQGVQFGTEPDYVGLAESEPVHPLFGRVSAVDGTLTIKGTGEDEWSDADINGIIADNDALLTAMRSFAELELPRMGFLRLGEGTAVDVVSVQDSRYRVLTGSVYVSLFDDPEIAVTIEKPSCWLLLTDQSVVRLDVDGSGGTRIHSLGGRTQVLGAGESSVSLQPEMRLEVSREGSFVALGAVTEVLTDGLAQWHLKREAYLAERALAQPVPPGVVGIHELSTSGEWITCEDIAYWRPRVEPGWRPYSVGVWHYSGPVGWYWVPRLHFEYVTCHYGYWHFSARHGWLWRPCWKWCPARVHWAIDDTGVYWAPTCFCHRTAPVTSSSFSLCISADRGSLSFGWWSYASFADFRLAVPHYTVIHCDTVIRDSAIVIVNNINTVTTLRPRVVVRGHRRDHSDHSHELLAAGTSQRRTTYEMSALKDGLDRTLSASWTRVGEDSRARGPASGDYREVAGRVHDMRGEEDRRVVARDRDLVQQADRFRGGDADRVPVGVIAESQPRDEDSRAARPEPRDEIQERVDERLSRLREWRSARESSPEPGVRSPRSLRIPERQTAAAPGVEVGIEHDAGQDALRRLQQSRSQRESPSPVVPERERTTATGVKQRMDREDIGTPSRVWRLIPTLRSPGKPSSEEDASDPSGGEPNSESSQRRASKRHSR